MAKVPQLGTELRIFSDPYPVIEHFYTLQGEGAHAGKAAYFIRLAGCDVGCVWCDVKESWTQGWPIMSAKQLADQVKAHSGEIVVITGGEPTMHEMTLLTKALKAAGKKIHIETSGAHAITGYFDWICLSPKKFKACLPENYAKAHELKVIVSLKHDLDWAIEEAKKVNAHCRLFIQPEWSKQDKVLPMMIDFVKLNPQWQISLQTHKYLDIP